MSFPTSDHTPSKRWIVIGAAGVGVLVIAAVLITALAMRADSPARTAPAPVPTSASAATAGATVIVADPAALDACDMANKMYKAPSSNVDLYTPAKTRRIGQRAAQSFNTEVKRWGTEIIEKADTADAAAEGDAKFRANLAAGGAVTQFLTYCTEQKFVIP